MKTAELNLAQVPASINASNTPSSATIPQDEALGQAGTGAEALRVSVTLNGPTLPVSPTWPPLSA